MDALARQRSATAAVWRADVASRPGGHAAQLGDCALHATGLAERQWNGAHVSGPDTPWDDVRGWFEERAVPWGICVPSELDVVPGTKHVVDQRVMLRDLDALPELTDLDLRWDAGEDASAVQAEAFECGLDLSREFVLPKFLNAATAVVVAYAEDVPVATATLVAVEGVAAVYGVGTVEAARRQGWGRAVTLAVLHEGLAKGCDLAFLNPSDLGYGTYARLGFADVAPFRIYAGIH
jgi:ribosomal protein S18 acetylase RimI-like enzyme